MLKDITDTFRFARSWLTATAAVTTLLVSMAGPAAAVSVPEVFSGFADFIRMSHFDEASASLDIPIGTYAITAKVYATNDNGRTNTVKCRLDGGTAFDDSAATLTPSVRHQTLAFNMVVIANFPKVIHLSCRNSNTDAVTFLEYMKITATRVADPQHLHNGPLSVAGDAF